MKALKAHTELTRMGQEVFTTADAAVWLGLSPSHASKTLSRLAKAGQVVSLARGLWAFEEKVRKLSLPTYLTAPFPSYVSLQSALYYHGMISQIPSITYAVSIARTKLYRTALGDVSVHHVTPEFFFGFERLDESGAWMATPEKALLDVLYLRPAKSRLFVALPELDLSGRIDCRRLKSMVKRIPAVSRRTMVAEALGEVLDFV